MRPLTVAMGDYGLTKPLKDATVSSDLADFRFIEVESAVWAMRKMARNLEFDISEMAFATYLCAREAGKPLIAIPVFLTRNFHHRAILRRVGSDVKCPQDLEHRIVGVNRGYTVTTGVWVRGILHSEYGVNLNEITWAATDDEHVQEYKAPANVTYSHRGQSVIDLLKAGEVAAAVGDLAPIQGAVQPLIPDPFSAGSAYFHKTGVYPANHLIVIKNSVLETHPTAPQALFKALTEAKAIHNSRLRAGQTSQPGDIMMKNIADVVGDPFPFGLEVNRTMIQKFIEFAANQKVIAIESPANALFLPDAMLVG